MARRSSNTGELPTDYAKLFDDIDDLFRRLAILETPSGEALASTVAKLQALVTNIQAQLDAWVAGRWTNAQIDSRIAAPPYSVAVGGNLSATGSIQASGQARFPDAVGFNITTTRRTLWIEDATGRLGYATSTEKEKAGIHPADEAHLLSILDVVPVTWWYREEIRRRTALRINDGVDYVPPRELGLIAEELDAAGFHEFVIYNPETHAPEGVEYSMIVVALIGAGRALRDEIAEIRSHLGIGSKA